MNPITPSEREPVLDALRGFAVLGILLVNVQVMRGPDWLVLMAGGVEAPGNAVDNVVRFAIGWLASGKFVSSLAFLFGLGAALIATRALDAGASPRPLLARRYACLMAFGLAHMPIFPGDILFLYGVTGMVLLAFVKLPVRTLLIWAAAIFAVYAAIALTYLASLSLLAADSGAAESAVTDVHAPPGAAGALGAYAEGTVADVLVVHLGHAFVLQGMQIFAAPLILALFLLGYAVGRSGLVGALDAHRARLRHGAWIGLGLGLPASLGLGLTGPLSGWGPTPASEPAWLTQWSVWGDLFGAPLLALGYLCALALWWQRGGASARLAAVGRMALTAYLLQSVLALAAFRGLALYGALGYASSLAVVAAIWAILLIACPLWLSRFRMGPVEWVWRSLAYARVQLLRRRETHPS